MYSDIKSVVPFELFDYFVKTIGSVHKNGLSYENFRYVDLGKCFTETLYVHLKENWIYVFEMCERADTEEGDVEEYEFKFFVLNPLDVVAIVELCGGSQ